MVLKIAILEPVPPAKGRDGSPDSTPLARKTFQS
jgi:hypothetical protein